MHSDKGSYYDPEEQRSPWLRILFIALGIIIILIITLLFVKMCDKKADLYSEIVSYARTYVKDNEGVLPTSVGQCTSFDLSTLKDNSALSKNSDFDTCDTTQTYVKVCKVSDEEYQYTPFVSCGNNVTEFSEWQAGTIDDLKNDNSDVEFKFIAEELKNGIKQYYPTDISDVSKISQYYVDTPSSEYTYKDSSEIAYKWYTEKQGKDYYNNGEYVSTEPIGYPNSENESSNKYASLSNPPSASYRTSKEATIYATETVAYPYKYDCKDTSLPGIITSPNVCENRDASNYKTTSKIYYTCDGVNEVSSGTVCSERTSWSLNNCSADNQTVTGRTSENYSYTRNVLTGYMCISTKGYSVEDKVWKWYKTGQVRSYYPSGESIAENESTYFITTPTAGSIKDEETKATAYKYYKLNETNDGNTTWVSASSTSMNEEELINQFKELGYDVNSLDDINNNDSIRYQIEITYRDRK